MTEAPTANAPITLDSIMQSLAEMIQKADPEKIKVIGEHMQAIIPAEDAEVTLRAGGSDEDKQVGLTFFVSGVKSHNNTFPLVELFKQLLMKTPMEEVEHLGKVLSFLESLEGQAYDWDMSKPYYSEGANSHTCYLYINKH